MEPVDQLEALLGALLRDAWIAGAPNLVLGQFACIQLGQPVEGAVNELGASIANLLRAEADTAVVGRFAALRIKGSAAQPIVDQIDTSKPAIEHSAVASMVRQVLGDMGVVRKSPARQTVPVKLHIDGRQTSVSIDKTLVEEFKSAFEGRALGQLAKLVGSQPVPEGQTRSYQVEKAMRAKLAEREQMSTNVVSIGAGRKA